MVSSFKFSNHITLSFGTSPWISPIAPIQPVSRAPIVRPHKSIPLPGSSQCHAPPWLSPTNQSPPPPPPPPPPTHTHTHTHPPTPTHPHTHTHMARLHNSIPSPTSSQCRTPMHSHSALFDVVTPPLSCSFSYLYKGPSYPTPNA